MFHLMLEVWNLLKELDTQGARFVVLYRRLDLQDGEAWAFVASLPREELALLLDYAKTQIRAQPAISTTNLSAYATSRSWLTDLSQSEEQNRHQHTLTRLQQL